jgi:polyphosphate kinase
MVRNLDHRIEAACPVTDEELKAEIIDILNIQLSDTEKARLLNKNLDNSYAPTRNKKKVKSQIEIYRYLARKKMASPMHERFSDVEAIGKI